MDWDKKMYDILKSQVHTQYTTQSQSQSHNLLHKRRQFCVHYLCTSVRYAINNARACSYIHSSYYFLRLVLMLTLCYTMLCTLYDNRTTCTQCCQEVTRLMKLEWLGLLLTSYLHLRTTSDALINWYVSTIDITSTATISTITTTIDFYCCHWYWCCFSSASSTVSTSTTVQASLLLVAVPVLLLLP